MKNRSTKNGSKNDDWETPDVIYQWITNYLQARDIPRSIQYESLFDPCPLHADFDGLEISWKKVNYINPPYTRELKEAFIRKAYQESLDGKICIMLIPVSTDTKIFHEVIAPNALVLLIKGRVKFKGYNSKGIYTEKNSGQSGSMFVIFGYYIEPCIKTIDLEKDKK